METLQSHALRKQVLEAIKGTLAHKLRMDPDDIAKLENNMPPNRYVITIPRGTIFNFKNFKEQLGHCFYHRIEYPEKSVVYDAGTRRLDIDLDGFSQVTVKETTPAASPATQVSSSSAVLVEPSKAETAAAR